MRNAIAAIFTAVLTGVFLPSSAQAAVPAEGVPDVHRQGAFLDARVGAATGVGGKSPDSGALRPSPPSVFLHVAGGYEFTDRLEAGASFSLAAVENRCMGQVSDKGLCIESASDWRGVSGDFTVATLAAFAAWKQPVTDRLRLVGGVSLGWAFLDPEPRIDLSGSFSVGARAGILWETPMDHFSIGIDLGWDFAVQASLHALSIAPWGRYTF